MAESGATYDPMQVEAALDDELTVSDDAPEEADTQAPQRGRKCVRNPDSWKKKHVKKTGL